jgi:putative ABC transport system permease protein
MFSLERIQFYLTHSINDLIVNGQRTLFGLFCIAAGVAAIVGLLTLGVMVEDTLTGSLQESNRGDMRVSPEFFFGDEDEVAEDEEDETRQGNSFTDEDLAEITAWLAEREGVPVEDVCTDATDLCVSPRLNYFVSFLFHEDAQNIVTIFAVESDNYPLYGEVETNDGQTLNEAIDIDSYSPESDAAEVVISQNLAEQVELEVGEEFQLLGSTKVFVVRGIVPTRTEGGLENIFSGIFGYVYTDISVRDLINSDAFSEEGNASEINYAQLYVRLDDPADLEATNDAFRAAFPNVTTTTTEDLREQNEQLSTFVTQFNSTMGLLSLLIGGIGIVNTMLVIVRRRTGEVAILKTIGLEPGEVSTLFFVESIMMGIIGSIVGIPFGFLIAFLTRDAVGAFVAEDLAFRIAFEPIYIGLIVGTTITAIFGLLPTLAAGQVRPASVLQPQVAAVPKAGIARSIFALVFIIIALSGITQGLLSELLTGDDLDTLRTIAQFSIGIMSFIAGTAMVAGGIWYTWTLVSENVAARYALRAIRWALLLVGLPVAGFFLGQRLPSVAVVLGVFIISAILYVLLWIIIWLVGRFYQVVLPVALLPAAALIFAQYMPLALACLASGGLAGITALILLFASQVDLRIAMRSMLATKGRIASTLLALIIGVFTLSLTVMLVTTISDAFEGLLEDVAGGNIIAITVPEDLFAENGDGDAEPSTIDALQNRLEEGISGVESYGIVRTYNTELISYTDVNRDETLNRKQISDALDRDGFEQEAIDDFFNDADAIDARSVDANLPDVLFVEGRQLAPRDEFEQQIVIPNTVEIQSLGIDVGDQLTFRFVDQDAGTQSGEYTFTVVGLSSNTGEIDAFGNLFYVPLNFLPPNDDSLNINPETVTAVVNADEDRVEDVARELRRVDNVLVLETRLFNDILNRLLETFTSLPIVVSIVVLITGGVVIANSVALSMLERRREIAIMKAVGLQRRRVLGMLLLENGIMGLIGGLIGVGISVLILLAFLIGLFQRELGEAVPLTEALLLMGACILIVLVASIVSVWSAASEKPLNVLRYE